MCLFTNLGELLEIFTVVFVNINNSDSRVEILGKGLHWKTSVVSSSGYKELLENNPDAGWWGTKLDASANTLRCTHFPFSCVSFRSGAPSPLSKVSWFVSQGVFLLHVASFSVKFEAPCVFILQYSSHVTHSRDIFLNLGTSLIKNESLDSWNSNTPCLLTSAPGKYHSFYIYKERYLIWVDPDRLAFLNPFILLNVSLGLSLAS